MNKITIYYHPTIFTLIPSMKFIWALTHKYKSLEITFLFWDINFTINQ
jgi:hypothetical protein